MPRPIWPIERMAIVARGCCCGCGGAMVDELKVNSVKGGKEKERRGSWNFLGYTQDVIANVRVERHGVLRGTNGVLRGEVRWL